MPLTGVPIPIAAICSTDAGQAILNNTWTVVNFDTKEADTHDAVTTGAAWHFTVPATGCYAFYVHVLFASTDTWADGEIGSLRACVDDVVKADFVRYDVYETTKAHNLYLCGGITFKLNAGELVDIRVFQNSGATLALFPSAAANRISIVKIAEG